MTRTQIHGGAVDILCSCGAPVIKAESLNYGFRLMCWCDECNVSFALDVIE